MGSVERDILDRLESIGVGYYITGSEALSTRHDDPWGRSAFERRILVDDPALGRAWVISPEDPILAKLWWSDHGASERQVRDATSVVRLSPALDWEYIDRYADVLDVRDLVDRLHADR